MDPDQLETLLAGLPDVNAVRLWAARMVALQGDAHIVERYPDGLNIMMGIAGHQMIVGQERHDATAAVVVRLVQTATYPSSEFGERSYDRPDRRARDLMWGHSSWVRLFDPLLVPTLVRVVKFGLWGDSQTESERVEYYLLELDPEVQRKLYAEIESRSRATRQ